jgi:cystathionine beta-lyase
MGAILCTEALHPVLRSTYRALGMSVGGDDAYLALRGLRTLSARLSVHARNARQIALWLQQRPEVAEVLYPPLEGSAGHAIWARDFRPEYACGLMGVVFKDGITAAQINRIVDATRLFGIGFSWGGYESLIIPASPAHHRDVTADRWTGRAMARLHIGLESTVDLIADLEQAFSVMHQ